MPYFVVVALFIAPPAYLIYLVVMYFKTGVPYVTTPRSRLPEILSAVPITSETVVYDLGCGKGDFLFAAEKFRPKKLIGFELSPLHAWHAMLKARLSGSQVRIYRKDFLAADFRDADVIYLFLVEKAVQEVWEKIRRSARPGTQVVVLSNVILSARPNKIITADTKSGSQIYVYRV